MRRDEACWELTKIAENELVSSTVSQRMFHIRDALVCETMKADELQKETACQFLSLVADNNLVSDEVNCELNEIVRRIKSGTLKDCEQVVYAKRCRECRYYKGERV